MTSIYTSDGPVVICDKEGPNGARRYTWYDAEDAELPAALRQERRDTYVRVFEMRDADWRFSALLYGGIVPGTSVTPKDELLWRLNTRLSGGNPGRPLNWRGVEDA